MKACNRTSTALTRHPRLRSASPMAQQGFDTTPPSRRARSLTPLGTPGLVVAMTQHGFGATPPPRRSRSPTPLGTPGFVVASPQGLALTEHPYLIVFIVDQYSMPMPVDLTAMEDAAEVGDQPWRLLCSATCGREAMGRNFPITPECLQIVNADDKKTADFCCGSCIMHHCDLGNPEVCHGPRCTSCRQRQQRFVGNRSGPRWHASHQCVLP